MIILTFILRLQLVRIHKSYNHIKSCCNCFPTLNRPQQSVRAADGRARVRVRWRLYQIFLNRLACSAADDGDDKITILHFQHTFLGTFLCHHWTTTTWKYLISRFMEDVNKRRRNSPFSFWSRMRFLRIDLQKRVLLHLIKVTAGWNEREFAF